MGRHMALCIPYYEGSMCVDAGVQPGHKDHRTLVPCQEHLEGPLGASKVDSVTQTGILINVIRTLNLCF